MVPNNLNRAQLKNFGDNYVEILTAGDAPDVPAGTQTAMATAAATVVTDLGTAEDAVVDALAVYRAAVQAAELTRQQVLLALQGTKYLLNSVSAPSEDYALLGFDPRAVSPVIYVPNDPTDCAAVGFTTGFIQVSFNGNNISGYITYQIWRREGDEGGWGIVGSTTRQTFKDRPITPGQYYEYKVKAVARRGQSDFSNSAVCYGV